MVGKMFGTGLVSAMYQELRWLSRPEHWDRCSVNLPSLPFAVYRFLPFRWVLITLFTVCRLPFLTVSGRDLRVTVSG